MSNSYFKGIRLNESQADWWEEQENPATSIRNYIDQEIEKNKSGREKLKHNIDKFPPDAINKLNKLINVIIKNDGDPPANEGIDDKDKLNQVLDMFNQQ